ncbi:MAG: heme-binding protein [Planctomycetota bacterium]
MRSKWALWTLLGTASAVAASTLVNWTRADELEFKLVKEAELPKGFPAHTPPGKIEVKHYPEYRKASATGGGAFWTLFRHIQKNDIAMTAPVEMGFGPARGAEPQESSMAFLYGSPSQGEAGREGAVEVTDVPATTVVSIGCRGDQDRKQAVADARDRLLEWLDQQDEYQIAGPLRVMGYNSPMVPASKRLFEVQIPIEKRQAAASE